MRSIGNVLLLLLLALFGCGFLIAYSLNLTQELTETRKQLTRMQTEMRTLETQYQVVVDEKKRLTEQILGLNSENAGLRTQVETLEKEQQALTGQIEALQSKLALIEKANPFLAWWASSPVRRLATLLIVPMVPLSFGAVYVMTHQKATNSPVAALKDQGSSQQTIFLAALTREEFHLIAQRRRSHAAERHEHRLGNT